LARQSLSDWVFLGKPIENTQSEPLFTSLPAMTSSGPASDIEQRAINVIRGLAMDMPQAANSGHPGTAMALAPLAHTLFTRMMNIDPSAADWFDRDRFVLSCGHASPLIYSMLHLCGYGLTKDDLRDFRQWGSLTPGHPEYRHTYGVEVTTGPLGQGFGNGVGMGIAEANIRGRFGEEVCNHYTYVICSDGDLQEGVSHEAASLAGHLGLGRLIYVYDDNHISIDGPTELSYSDNVPERFEAYGWDVNNIGEVANEVDVLEDALLRAKEISDKPSMIVLRSHIGWPSPKFTDTAEAHGNPLGEDEVRKTKEILGLPPDEKFYVPQDVLDYYRSAIAGGAEKRKAWEQRVSTYTGDRESLIACINGVGVSGWEAKLPQFEAGSSIATRVAIGDCLNAVLDVVPGIMAGGADLTGNTGTKLNNTKQFTGKTPDGRQIYFGIREHGMGATLNGMAYHGGVIPFGGTFFVFSDYMRGAVRLAALSQIHSVFVWTHDSVGLGEDGPTHQPIEQLPSLRAMPGLTVLRPADANETSHALSYVINNNRPIALLLTRQKIPNLEGTSDRRNDFARGAYVLRDVGDEPDLILVSSGSEVHVCLAAAEQLTQQDELLVRVVSMPSWELFEEQSDDYQDSIFPDGIPVLSVEAASSFGWDRYADDSVSIETFGASAPGEIALANFGFTTENVAQRGRELLDEMEDEVESEDSDEEDVDEWEDDDEDDWDDDDENDGNDEE
jgi:transketolase